MTKKIKKFFSAVLVIVMAVCMISNLSMTVKAATNFTRFESSDYYCDRSAVNSSDYTDPGNDGWSKKYECKTHSGAYIIWSGLSGLVGFNGCDHIRMHQHNYNASLWKNDETNHWHECTDTDCIHTTKGKKDEANHDWSNNDGKCTVCAYLCQHDGKTSGTCAICGKNLGGGSTQGTFEHPHDKEQNNFASGGLVGSPNEIINAVLTETEKQDFAAGGNYSVWLELGKKEANNVDDAEKQKINAKLPGGFSIGTYLDIQLKKQGPGDDEGKLVTNTPGNVTIKLTVPTELQKAGRTYKIIRYHGDEATVLDAKLSDGYVLTFATNGFSTYALIYSDEAPAAAPAPAPAPAPKAPKTGDTSNMPLVMLILAMGVVGLGFISRKKITK